MSTRVCVVTGSRAEYGLISSLLQQIECSNVLDLQLVVTGSHLSPHYGLTIKEILSDGHTVDWKVEMQLSSDSRVGTTKSMGLAMIGMADAIDTLSPDLVVITGDRFESFACAASACIASVPVVHMHGGELTYGAMDEYLRHSITKLSSIHFASTEAYRKRIIQMGEHPSTVFNVGALGLDNITGPALLDKKTLEDELGIPIGDSVFLVTYHPETRGAQSNTADVHTLLSALDSLENDATLIFTAPNTDPDNHEILRALDQFTGAKPNRHLFSSLGHKNYLSLLNVSTVVIGNSSSGIIEAPSLHVPTVDIGNRQNGRESAQSVINVPCDTQKILDAIKWATSLKLTDRAELFENPYGSGGAAKKIVEHLERIDISTLQSKRFYDIPFSHPDDR